jgi:hypothetical protein
LDRAFKQYPETSKCCDRVELSEGETMIDNTPFLKLDQPCEEAVEWVSERVGYAGLSVMRTFDLQVARHAQTVCPCPHHGTDQCDCQMVVLLVYQYNQRPLTMIAHGHSGQTWFSMVDTPQQRADPHLEAVIRQLLSAPNLPPINLINHAHAV